MKKKKILIIATNDLGKSGVPEVIMEIVRLLHDSYLFDIVITRNNTYYQKEFESFGGSVYTIFEKEYKNKFLRLLYKLTIFRSKIRKMFKLFSRNGYYAIHSFKDLEGGYYLKCAKKIGINNRISHCSRQYFSPKSKVSQIKDRRLLNSILRYATQLIAISYSSGKSLFGLNQKFEVLYNTYNETYYTFNSVPPPDNLSLLQIGTFLPIKNQLFSLNVLKQIIKIIPSTKMYFIGRVYDKKYYEEFIKQIKLNNLSKNIEICNYDYDQNELFEKVTFSIIPSINEGLSLTAIESQAKGIKCFASTGVPNEVSCGNIEFLELEESLWAKKIITSFYETKGTRKKVDMKKFSNSSFKNKMISIYEN